MTETEIAQVIDLIEQYRWFAQAPTGSGEPKGLTYRIELAGPKARGWLLRWLPSRAHGPPRTSPR